ncbi:MAG: hypothetical protein JXA53_12375 [Bacteroidales bacterium]|nr:hypothetical protein [Bacteroidales bacterium]
MQIIYKKKTTSRRLAGWGEIRWYQVGTSKTSKDEIINMLKTKECREAIEKLGADKANALLNRTDLDNEFKSEISEAFINWVKNSNDIFK